MNLPVPNGDAEESAEAAAGHGAETRRTTRRKLDEIFGDVLPNVTRDELADRAEELGRDAERDSWYRDNRPPHHG